MNEEKAAHRQLEHHHHSPVVRRMPVCLLLHNMDMPTNVGSLFRLGDAFGIERLYLSGDTSLPPNRKLRRTSRATEQFVSYQHVDDPVRLIHELKNDGFRIVSLELTKYSVDIRSFKCDAGDKICLIPGAESAGVALELLNLSDDCFHISMRGENSSMNVASACSIALYEFSRWLA